MSELRDNGVDVRAAVGVADGSLSGERAARAEARLRATLGRAAPRAALAVAAYRVATSRRGKPPPCTIRCSEEDRRSGTRRRLAGGRDRP